MMFGKWKKGKKSPRDQKAEIMLNSLDSEEGRAALAQAMVETIKRELDYQAVGRKLFAVDELPHGALARFNPYKEYDFYASTLLENAIDFLDSLGYGYEEDEPVEFQVLRKIKEVRYAYGEVVIPSFELASNPSVKLSDVRNRRFNVVDRKDAL